MKTNIVVNLQIEGMHSWPEAKVIMPEVGFLSDVHRHMFHITAKKRVNHDYRDVEFIMFKRDIAEMLMAKYYVLDYRCCFFGSRSCEMIAREILDAFNCEYVSVFEDGENGAEIINQ